MFAMSNLYVGFGVETVARRAGRMAGPARASAGFARALSILARCLQWPLRVFAARRDLAILAGMSEHELKDIGLTRCDVSDTTALPSGASPADFLAARVEERRSARRR
jgi:uncharacterized protein YjiS (DUF1127 family)